MTGTRRQFLASTLPAAAVALAGCVDGGSGSDDTGSSGTEEDEDVRAQRTIGDVALRSSFPIEIYAAGTDDRQVQLHWHGTLDSSHWHQSPFRVPHERWESYDIRVYDESGGQLSLGEDEQFRIELEAEEVPADDHIEHDISGNQLDIRGQVRGLGNYVLHIVHDGERVWETPILQIDVD